MENIHEEVRNGLKIKIFQDDCDQSPDTWGDNGLFLVGYHRDFHVEGPKRKNGFSDPLIPKVVAQDIAAHDFDPPAPLDTCDEDQTARELGAKYHFFPLSAHIHSGVRLYLGRISRDWDNSVLGLVAVSREEAQDLKRAEDLAQGLVDTWNDYLSGNVYGFQVEDTQGQHIDSCWGFYGDYNKDGGALIEARAVVDHLTNKGATDHSGQLLMPWAPEIAPATK